MAIGCGDTIFPKEGAHPSGKPNFGRQCGNRQILSQVLAIAQQIWYGIKRGKD